jgi:hypothetical protein
LSIINTGVAGWVIGADGAAGGRQVGTVMPLSPRNVTMLQQAGDAPALGGIAFASVGTVTSLMHQRKDLP